MRMESKLFMEDGSRLEQNFSSVNRMKVTASWPEPSSRILQQQLRSESDLYNYSKGAPKNCSIDKLQHAQLP
jgi:hypothetical protein